MTTTLKPDLVAEVEDLRRRLQAVELRRQEPAWETTGLIGEIRVIAFDAEPATWLVCDGRVVAQSDYPVLYSRIGLSWATAPVDPGMFPLPDLRERVMIGASAGRPFASAGGAAAVSLTGEQNGPHSHSASTASDGAHTHDYWMMNPGLDIVAAGSTYPLPYVTPEQTSAAGAHTHAVTVNSSGDGSPHENMMPYLAFNVIIKAL